MSFCQKKICSMNSRNENRLMTRKKNELKTDEIRRRSIMQMVLSFIILTVYGRFFKLYMYTAIAPIPLSTFAGRPT